MLSSRNISIQMCVLDKFNVYKRAAMIILYKSIFSHTLRDSLRLRVETIIGAVEKLTYCLDIQLNQISHKSNR